MKGSTIPLRPLDWFLSRIGKEVRAVSVHGEKATTILIVNESLAKELYLDTQWTFNMRFTD